MKKTSTQNLTKITPSSPSPRVERVGVRSKNLAGFTLVEIITTIAIIAVISILGFTYANNYKLTQYNTVRASDIDLLNNTMQTYYETHNKYPLPAGNKQYFDEYGVYTHSATGAYGVSGFITSETFGKEFMLVTQKDPTTKYYYAYSRTLDNKPSFQFATSLDQQGTFYGYVKGTYSDNNLAGIVREYNGPNFVINNNARYLPYNPNELKLTGNVISYSGGVQILKDSSVVDIGSELEQGFQVRTDTGALATINLSDGSELRLGSTIRSSVLDFKDLTYKQDDNLLTKISLKLSLGEVWVKAPQLEQGSEFSLETDNAAASVRGTVFGMTSNGRDETTISLIEGKLEIFALDRDGGHLLTFPGITVNSTGAISSTRGMESATTIMSVPEGGDPVYLNYKENENHINSSTSTTGTGSSSFTTSSREQIMQPQVRVKSSYIPKVLSFERSTSAGSLKISNMGANSYNVRYFTGGINSITASNISNGIIDPTADNVSISLSSLSGVNAIEFQICDDNSAVMLTNTCTNTRPCTQGALEISCSSWKRLGIDTKPVVVSEELMQKIEAKQLQIEGCPEGKEFSSITNQCETPGLVAYAGYNTPGDIFMSITGDKVLPTHSDSVVSTGVYNLDNILNKVDAWNILRNTTSWYGLMSRVPEYDNSIFKNTYITDNSLLNNTGGFLSFNTNFSYFTLPYDGVFNNGGIFLDKKTTVDLDSGTDPDYLSYDISPLQLNGPYTIEMSVRGAALKRTTGTGILFSIPDPSNNSKYLYFGIEPINGIFKLTLGYSPNRLPRSPNIYYFEPSYIANKLDKDKFYTLKIVYTHSRQNTDNTNTGVYIYGSYPYIKQNFQISIKDNNGLDVISFNTKSPNITVWGMSDIATLFTPQKIFIGSDPSGQNQWNDIIDYVKIYKN